jgi:hypothetical protein
MGTLQGVGVSPTLQEASSTNLIRGPVLLSTEVPATNTVSGNEHRDVTASGVGSGIATIQHDGAGIRLEPLL